jgi:uncharacterized protein
MPVKKPGRPFICALAAVLWAALALPAHAAIVAGLYEARVPVADQSSPARSAALQQALAAVLVKVTEAPPDPSAAAAAAPQAPSLVLWAQFDLKRVDDAVAAAHVPLWGAERPRTLVWLALQDGPGGRLLPATDSSTLMQALITAAQQRGITLMFPQLDAVDQAAIGVPDVTGFAADRIRQASARYRPDAVLVGSVTPFGNGQYAARWMLLDGSQQQAWQTPPGDEVVTAVDGIQVSADRYAALYAVAPDAGDVSGVPVAVQGVTSLDVYAKVLAYLSGLAPVRAVRVQRMEQGSAYFSVDAHGSLDNLRSALVLGGLLAPVDAPAAAPATAAPGTSAVPTQPLLYRYVPGP